MTRTPKNAPISITFTVFPADFGPDHLLGDVRQVLDSLGCDMDLEPGKRYKLTVEPDRTSYTLARVGGHA